MLRVIAGLGNPGTRYQTTRHNAGFWFIDALIERFGGQLQTESRFNAQTAKCRIAGNEVLLICPQTFMNRSGQAVGDYLRYFKIAPDELLVVHDELDLSPGCARLKKGGGHGGHNGLRDIHQHLGSADYLRLRVGIGHPGQARQVSDYVLSPPSTDDKVAIASAIDLSVLALEKIFSDTLEKATHYLHSNC
jgi:PTH1 family peptidyl-tRNA hydrolase